jgi:DUF1680 family protein
MLEKGATYGGSNAQIWAPYYTLHKIMAGLMDIYEVSGNEKALEIAKGMGTWVYARLSQLPKGDADKHVEQVHRRGVRRDERGACTFVAYHRRGQLHEGCSAV